MVRNPTKILTFKRLTRGARDEAWHLNSNIHQKTRWIYRKLRATSTGQAERAYLYVAMATCLEADVKHRTKLALDIFQNDIDLFKKLYGEAKLDLDLLFHVVEDNPTLGDLLGEVTNVSDVRGLISKCETLLDAISGSTRSFKDHIKAAAAAKQKGDVVKPFFDIFLAYYDGAIVELEKIFQIRHAVVHEVFNEGGPIGWAVSPERLRQVYSCFLNFLLVWQDTYWHAMRENSRPTKRARPEAILKQAIAREASLVRRQPRARRYVSKLLKARLTLIGAIFDMVGVIEGKRKPETNDDWPVAFWNIVSKFFVRLSTQLDAYSLEQTTRRKERAAEKRDPSVRHLKQRLHQEHRRQARKVAP